MNRDTATWLQGNVDAACRSIEDLHVLLGNFGADGSDLKEAMNALYRVNKKLDEMIKRRPKTRASQ